MNNAKSYKTALLSLIILPCSSNAMQSKSRGFQRLNPGIAIQMQKDRQEAERILKEMQEKDRERKNEENLQKSKNRSSDSVTPDEESLASIQDLIDQANSKTENEKSNKQDQTLENLEESNQETENLEESPLDRANLSSGIQFQHARLKSMLAKPKNHKDFSADRQESSDD